MNNDSAQGVPECAQECEQALVEIRELLDGVERMLAAGASAADIYERMYVDDALVVGEGQPRGLRGRDGLVPAVQSLLSEHWGLRPHCRYLIQRPAVLGTDAAATLVEFRVRPDEGRGDLQVYRALYAWTRTPMGWRVRLETYGSGHV